MNTIFLKLVIVIALNILCIYLLQAITRGWLHLDYLYSFTVYAVVYGIIATVLIRKPSIKPSTLWQGLGVSTFFLILLFYFNNIPLLSIYIFLTTQLIAYTSFYIFYHLNQHHKHIVMAISVLSLALSIYGAKEIIMYHNYNSGNDKNFAHKAFPYHFSLYDTANQAVPLEKIRNQVVLIDFWTTHCKSCIKKMPLMDSLYNLYQKDTTVEIISVISGGHDTMRNLKSLMQKRKPKHPILFDKDGILSSYYKIDAFPIELIVSPTGRVMRRYLGFSSDHSFLTQYNQDTQKLFNKALNH